MRPELEPPSGGTRPAASVRLADGTVLHLSVLAREISERFLGEHPDEAARYGEAGLQWCVHDNHWLLAWAVEDLEIGRGHLAKNVRWLADLLRARDYPAERLARDLEIAADVLRETGGSGTVVAARLATAAARLRRARGAGGAAPPPQSNA